ncbi:MAG TPA: hypothetical protein VL882_17470 [Vicinamibacterales bacterium]|nr:hypothetical protein [Vicinamibacterales bacterium]
MLPSRLLIVRQAFPDARLPDVREETRRQMEQSGFAGQLKPGARVAIGVGSRGIANIAAIVHSVVEYWRSRDMAPFIFPAMGSHGAATAEGQADVLARFGITEQSIGCPIVSRLDVVSLGKTGDGVEVFMDAAAHAADAVMIVARVKWHTTFSGRLESGLMKMMAIGLGKFAGAQKYHTHAKRLGLEHVIRTAGRHVLASGKMIGGIAVVEDAYHNTAKIEAVPAGCTEQRDEENLALAKSWMPKLPCDLDVLIVDRMGKNISGTGMDAKVVNRGEACEYNPWPGVPSIQRLFVRDLEPETHGNAMGIGMADVTTDRLVRQIDWKATRVNALSSGLPARIRVPLHFPSDRECLQWVAATAGKMNAEEVTYGWIRNTLALDRVVISSNLRANVASQSHVEIEQEIDAEWDDRGNLVSPFYQSRVGIPAPRI